MKNLSSVMGWVLLTAVLAVPSFLFYNWWAANKAKEAQLAAVQPVPKNFFPTGESPGGGATRPAAPAAVSTPSVTAAAAPRAQERPEPALSTGAVRAAASVRGSTSPAGSYFDPRRSRDPFVSPDDFARIRAEEYRRLEAERMSRLRETNSRREELVESRMNIQGIVGSNAIINGEMYSAGDAIFGAKILKVGPSYIIGEHKGRRFRKNMD